MNTLKIIVDIVLGCFFVYSIICIMMLARTCKSRYLPSYHQARILVNGRCSNCGWDGSPFTETPKIVRNTAGHQGPAAKAPYMPTTKGPISSVPPLERKIEE